MTTALNGNPWFWMLLIMTVPIILGCSRAGEARSALLAHVVPEESRTGQSRRRRGGLAEE